MFPQLSGLGQNITYITSGCLNDHRETAAKRVLMMTNHFSIAFIDMSIKSAHLFLNVKAYHYWNITSYLIVTFYLIL